MSGVNEPTAQERQEVAVRVLILLEPKDAHDDKRPAHRRPEARTCHLLRNARTQAAVLDDAGLLCALVEVPS